MAIQSKVLIVSMVFGFFLSAKAAPSKYISATNVIKARDCVLQIVAEKMNVTLDAEKTKPRIRPESVTKLEDFQDSIEEFWNFRPDQITNVFQPYRNEIYVINERAYYDKHERSVYDSLAHELVHYVQYAYQKADFTVGDDSLEWHAIDVQTWFRETYKSQFQKDKFICPIQQEKRK